MNLAHRRWRAAAAAVLLAAAIAPLAVLPAAADSPYLAASCNVKLRSSPSVSATSPATIPSGALVTVTGTVPGGSWSADCPSTVSGSTWYTITAVNGIPVSSTYGLPVVFAATGLFQTPIYLEGVDVSTYQGTVDWPSVYSAGRRFAIMRATLGQTYLDPTYATNHAGARAAGLAVAAYHYAKPSSDPNDAILEADWFMENAALVPGDLVPALDIEETGGLSVTDLQAWIGAWLGEVYARLGVRAMIYTSPNFWKNALGDTTMFADQGYTTLWVAHWGVSSPSVPANNWGGHGWTFWQYTSSGSVAGISGDADLDRYNGLDITPMAFSYPPLPPLLPPPPPPAAPVVAAIAPASATVGSTDLTVSITGSNFQQGGGSTAYLNQFALGTTYVSPSQLTAVIPAALLTTPGSGSLMVVNQPGGSSSAVPFEVTLPPAQLTLTPSATVVTWGQPVTLNATIGPSGANRTITLQQLPATAPDWADVTAAVTDASGNASFTFSPRTNTQFRVSFAGAADLGPGTSTPFRVVVRQLVLLRPTGLGAVKVVSTGTKVTFTATVRPIGPDLAPPTVTFAFFRYVNGEWKQATARTLRVDATGRASTTWMFSLGGQWYVRAVANPTLTNANSYWSAIERYSVR